MLSGYAQAFFPHPRTRQERRPSPLSGTEGRTLRTHEGVPTSGVRFSHQPQRAEAGVHAACETSEVVCKGATRDQPGTEEAVGEGQGDENLAAQTPVSLNERFRRPPRRRKLRDGECLAPARPRWRA